MKEIPKARSAKLIDIDADEDVANNGVKEVKKEANVVAENEKLYDFLYRNDQPEQTVLS